MDRMAVLFGRHRLVLACCVVVFTGICFFGLSRLTFDNDPLKLLRSKKIEVKQLEGDFADLERTILIVVEGKDLLTSEGVGGMRKITEGALKVNGVGAVSSMLNLRDNRRIGRYLLPFFPPPDAPDARFERLRSRAASHPLLIGHFLSEDWKTALVIVQFDDTVGGIDEAKSVLTDLQKMLDENQDLMEKADKERPEGTEPFGLRARITGMTALQVEAIESMRIDIFKFSLAGAALVVVIAIVLFRRVGAALLVASGPTVGTIWAMGMLGLIGEPINMLTNVVPVLVLVIGFTDSMHLVLHVRRALAEGSSSLEAAQSAIRHLGLACALTSLSTAVGFGSLMVASLDGIRTFGWCCALGSVCSFFAVITVVPLLASTPLAKYVVAKRPPSGQSRFGSFADRLITGLLRYRRGVLACGAVLTLALAWTATGLEPDHKIETEIPHNSEAYRALEHIDDTFGGVMFAYAVVEWPEKYNLRSQEVYDVLEEVDQVLDQTPELSNTLSVLNLVKSLPGRSSSLARRASELRYMPEQILHSLVGSDQQRALVSAHMPDVGARLLKPAFIEVDRQFEEIGREHPGFHVELVGGSVTVFRNVHLMIEDLWKSLATAAGVMFLMIWVGLRSLRYALVSIVPNVFPLLCTGAFIVLTGRYLEMSTVIVFSISLGIAVDDTIHFLVRFKREMASGADADLAIRRTFKVVGTAIVMTTVALVGGHLVVMISAFPAIQLFGLLAAVTIASALIGDLLILPAILACLKWPGESSAADQSPPENS